MLELRAQRAIWMIKAPDWLLLPVSLVGWREQRTSLCGWRCEQEPCYSPSPTKGNVVGGGEGVGQQLQPKVTAWQPTGHSRPEARHILVCMTLRVT